LLMRTICFYMKRPTSYIWVLKRLNMGIETPSVLNMGIEASKYGY